MMRRDDQSEADRSGLIFHIYCTRHMFKFLLLRTSQRGVVTLQQNVPAWRGRAAAKRRVAAERPGWM